MARKNITFEVPGQPKSKGRARSTKAGHHYTPRATTVYETAIEWSASLAINAWKLDGGYTLRDPIPWLGFMRVTIMANIEIPKSWSKAKHLLAIDGLTVRPGKPDLDNYLKIVLDALNGVVYKDDAQVQQVSGLKRYSANPCMIITVEEL
jgi:Holliday junction resolvase RusA-like endonuclease|tara:strand:+ start:3620 stop:4069 length:450 start_codon:yes stop_codon:yes gene_type:complete